jgi:uncharacterized membrane protein YeaQ/YmgE (transglycosylase-associated protein family)
LSNSDKGNRHGHYRILTFVIGIVGALAGGWVAAQIFHLHHAVQGFFNASTWLTAIAGAAVLLLAYHLATGQTSRSGSGSSRSGRRFAHR